MIDYKVVLLLYIKLELELERRSASRDCTPCARKQTSPETDVSTTRRARIAKLTPHAPNHARVGVHSHHARGTRTQRASSFIEQYDFSARAHALTRPRASVLVAVLCIIGSHRARVVRAPARDFRRAVFTSLYARGAMRDRRRRHSYARASVCACRRSTFESDSDER